MCNAMKLLGFLVGREYLLAVLEEDVSELLKSRAFIEREGIFFYG